MSEDAFVGAERRTVSPLFNVTIIEEPSLKSSLAVAKIENSALTPKVPEVPSGSTGTAVPSRSTIAETPNSMISGAMVSMLMVPTVTEPGNLLESGLLPASVVLLGSIARTFRLSVLCPG